jgi:pyruvate-ferredoxin/flavodoxin oxidoreductase
MAMDYGYVYVACVAMGANDAQTLRAIQEAESYEGPALILAYSHCIAHGINMAKGMEQQRLAVESGHWPLFRYDPRLRAEGKNPFQLDSKPPKIRFRDYAMNETRYRMLMQSDPAVAEELMAEAEQGIARRWKDLEYLAAEPVA